MKILIKCIYIMLILSISNTLMYMGYDFTNWESLNILSCSIGLWLVGYLNGVGVE